MFEKNSSSYLRKNITTTILTLCSKRSLSIFNCDRSCSNLSTLLLNCSSSSCGKRTIDELVNNKQRVISKKKLNTYGFLFQLVFGPVYVQQWRDPNQQSPPRPIPDHHELFDVPLYASYGDIVHFAFGVVFPCQVSATTGLQLSKDSRQFLVSLRFERLQDGGAEKYLIGGKLKKKKNK